MPEWLRIQARIEARGFDVAIGVSQGQTVAIVGPNGAGKSTLLQLVAGSLRPDAGEVWLGDELLSGARAHLPAHRRRFSYIEQRSLLFPHLSVLDNVAFGPRSRGVPKAQARSRARAELEAVGVAELAQRQPSALSGGQAQRAAIARALAIDPQIVLLDEPFAALDVSVTPELRRLMRERLAGRTALLVTHDLLDVVTLADRLVVIEHGQIVADGEVGEVCANPPIRFLADFVGVNLVHGIARRTDALSIGDQVLVGRDAGLVVGQPARATVAPNAIAVYLKPPDGSPRNVLRGTVTGVASSGPAVEVLLLVGDQRLRAELTPGAVAELGLVPGTEVFAVLKATQVGLHLA